MEIRITYVGRLNGINGIWCGFNPDGLEVDEERLVLYPAEGYKLKNKISGETLSAVWINSEEQQNDWEEITEEYYRKLQAQMTPREFILALMAKGITREQIETLINSNDRVWAELNYATLITRANPLLDQLCGQFGLTTHDVDEMFGV